MKTLKTTCKTVTLKNAYGRIIRRATNVIVDWGTNFASVTFTEVLPKRLAIPQALEMLRRDGTIR